MKTSTLKITTAKLDKYISTLRAEGCTDAQLHKDYAIVIQDDGGWYSVVLIDRGGNEVMVIDDAVSDIGSHAEVAASEVAAKYGLRSQKDIDRDDAQTEANARY